MDVAGSLAAPATTVTIAADEEVTTSFINRRPLRLKHLGVRTTSAAAAAAAAGAAASRSGRGGRGGLRLLPAGVNGNLSCGGGRLFAMQAAAVYAILVLPSIIVFLIHFLSSVGAEHEVVQPGNASFNLRTCLSELEPERTSQALLETDSDELLNSVLKCDSSGKNSSSFCFECVESFNEYLLMVGKDDSSNNSALPGLLAPNVTDSHTANAR